MVWDCPTSALVIFIKDVDDGKESLLIKLSVNVELKKNVSILKKRIGFVDEFKIGVMVWKVLD